MPQTENKALHYRKYRCAFFYDEKTTPVEVVDSFCRGEDTARMSLHDHDFMELSVVLKGRNTHYILDPEGTVLQYSLCPGNIYLIRMREQHCYWTQTPADTSEVINILFSPRALQYLDYPACEENRLVKFINDLLAAPTALRCGSELRLNPAECRQFRELALLLKETIGTESPCRTENVAHLFCCVLALGMRPYMKTAAALPASGNYTILRLIGYLEQHYSEPISLEQLAASFYCSVSHLTHQFRLYTGESIGAYIQRRRILKACHLLEQSTLSVTEIAKCAGFGDPCYFSRAFRRATGFSPRDYRLARDGCNLNV